MSKLQFNINKGRTLIMAGMAMLLASCGGGSGGSNTNNTEQPPIISPSAPTPTPSQPTPTPTPTPEPTPSPTPEPNPSPSPTPTPTPSPSPAVPGPAGQDASQYTLTFNDDFNSFNTSIWNDYRAVWESPGSTKNYTVENGVLKMWPLIGSSGNFVQRTINTENKWDQTYGYFEVEAKLPIGKGVWPAIWLLGDTQEVDIMEAYPGKNWEAGYIMGDASMHPIAYDVTVWFWPNNSDTGNQVGTKRINTVDLSAGFHKYGMKWEPNKQTFYFDGKQVYSLNVTMPEKMFMILDLWYENQPTDHPDGTTPTGKSNSFEVNYVRAWKFK